jgi:D-serine deaminase-like pyridoxal phosphate-dependent protein
MKGKKHKAPSRRKARHVADLDTPALLVDLDVLDANIAKIAEACSRHGVGWRPHIKGQKVPEIVRREINAGAIGITCAKLGEAEVMAKAGFGDILIANQIVGTAKIARLVDLARRTRVMVAVDNADNAAALGAAAAAKRVTLPVVIEIDIGMKRAGVLPGAPALALAERIAATRGLAFQGLMAWEAHAVRIADPAEKKRTVEEAVGALVATADLIRSAGLTVKIVSCGGTGTFPLTLAVRGVTEIQAGGGVHTDVS